MCDVAALGYLIIRQVSSNLVLGYTRVKALSLKDIHGRSLHVLILQEVKLAVAIVG